MMYKKLNCMKLTLEEKRSIAKYVIYSRNGLFLNEAVSNRNIRNEIKLNFLFYDALKESLFKTNKQVINEDVLAALGGIKDLLTGTDVVQKLLNWINTNLLPYLEKLLNGFVPTQIQDAGKQVAQLVFKFVEWFKKTISYEGLAKLFARIKYKKLLQSPSQDEINCMMVAAKTAYKYILIALVSAFLIKIANGSLDAVDVLTQQDNLLSSLDTLTVNAGLGKIFGVMFGTYGTITKANKAKHLSDDVKKKRNSIQNQTISTFKGDWNYCN